MARRYVGLSQGSREAREPVDNLRPPEPTRLARRLAEPGARRQPLPEDVLHAARRRFLRGERVDMNDLAREVGIGRATLYRWVGSRDQLLGEVLWSLAA